MPTYVYTCTACGQRLEAVQRITDAPLTTCTVCSGALRKVFQPVGVVFKGSGFYRTDSRNGSKSAGSASASSTESSGSTGASTSGSNGASSSGSGSTSPKASTSGSASAA